MALITNDCFDAREKALLEFVLRCDFPQRKDFLEQLERMKPEDLVRDVTPFYWILEFRPAGTRPGYEGMRPVAEISVGHPIPTIFVLYERDDRVFELEIYNADSSAMDLEQIMGGQLRTGSSDPKTQGMSGFSPGFLIQ